MKKKLTAIVVAGTILTANLAAPITASADELVDKIEQQEQKISEISAQEAAAQTNLNQVSSEIEAAEQRAAELLEQRVAAQEELDTLKEQIANLEKIIAEREEQLDEQARSVQVNGSTTSYISFIFASETFTDLISRVGVVASMVSANKDLVEKQVADKEAVDEKKVATEETMDQIIASSSELETLKGELEVKRIEQESAVAALSAEKANAEEDRQQFLAQKEEADKRAAEEKARQEEVAAQLAKEQEEAAAAALAAAEEAEKDETEKEELTNAAEAVQVASTETAAVTAAPASTVSESAAVEEETAATVVSQPAAAPVATPVATTTTTAPAASTALPAATSGVISVAKQYLGTPYVWGGKTPSGFDCSGLAYYVFKQTYGINIGVSTTQQEYAGTKISLSQAQPGDLLFWGSRGATYHVAIYLGNNSYIHAPYEGRNVEVNYFQYFQPSFAVRVSK